MHLARLLGPEGFSRVVAVKRMHRHVLHDAELKGMFAAEARLAARVQHPNVVPILDVLSAGDELMIVMEYVHGESLQVLLRELRSRKAAVPLPIAATLMLAVLHGLHAAHEARGEDGQPLNIVHRDVTPHNVLVGADGVARVLDFGVAKTVQANEIKPELIKGKFSYMAPEVIRRERITRQADIFSAATVYWELLTGKRLFDAPNERARLISILSGKYPGPRRFNPDVPESVEAIVMRGLRPDPQQRYATALDMAIELERAVRPASQRQIGEWVRGLVSDTLNRRVELIQHIETSSIITVAAGTRATLEDAVSPPQDGSVQRPAVRPLPWLLIALLGGLAAAAAWGLGAKTRPEESTPRARSESVKVPPAPASAMVVGVQTAVRAEVAPKAPSKPASSTLPEPRPALKPPAVSAPPRVPERAPSRARRSADVRGGDTEEPKKPSYAKDFLPNEL